MLFFSKFGGTTTEMGCGNVWGTTWARPNVHEMLSIVRLVLACGLPTQKAGHASREEQDSDSTETQVFVILVH